jgi:CBS domain-containing protein
MDDIVSRRHFTTYPVTDNGRVLGLLPFRCVARVPRGEWDSRTVRECMLPVDRVPIVRESDELIDAAVDLGEGDVHRALVLDGDQLVGLLSATDVARALEGRRRLRDPG